MNNLRLLCQSFNVNFSFFHNLATHSYDYRPNWTPLSPFTVSKIIITDNNYLTNYKYD